MEYFGFSLLELLNFLLNFMAPTSHLHFSKDRVFSGLIMII